MVAVNRQTTEKLEARLSLEQLIQMLEKHIPAFTYDGCEEDNSYYFIHTYSPAHKEVSIDNIHIVKEIRRKG